MCVRGRHYGDLEKSDALCVYSYSTLPVFSLSPVHFDFGNLCIYGCHGYTARRSISRKPFILWVLLQRNSLRPRSLLLCSFYLRPRCCSARVSPSCVCQPASFFANNQKEERWKMSLDAPPDDEKCCCYCEKINSPARSSREATHTHSPGRRSLLFPSEFICV